MTRAITITSPRPVFGQTIISTKKNSSSMKTAAYQIASFALMILGISGFASIPFIPHIASSAIYGMALSSSCSVAGGFYLAHKATKDCKKTAKEMEGKASPRSSTGRASPTDDVTTLAELQERVKGDTKYEGRINRKLAEIRYRGR